MAGIAVMTNTSAETPARNRPAPTRRPARFQVAADASDAGIADAHAIDCLRVWQPLDLRKVGNRSCQQPGRALRLGCGLNLHTEHMEHYVQVLALYS